MSRITGTDAFNMMEAYNAVYTPQELTEEQVWEEVENWVNSLVEEGHDLSEYTWEDMYEAYLDEIVRPTTGQMTAPKRDQTQTAARPAPQAIRPAGGGMGGMRGTGRNRTSYQTSSSPGALRVPPTSAPYQSRFAGARDAAFARARQIQGSPVVGPRVAAPASAPARPAATAPARPAATAPTQNSARPTATPATTTAPATTPAAPSRPSLRSDIADLQKMRLASQERQRKGGATVVGSQMASFDMFDVVKGHLIDEGYADTEEAALQIMANMSEEWRESILDEASVYGARKGTIRSVIAKGGGPGSIKYVASGGDIIAGDRAAQERSDAAEGKRARKNRANAARLQNAHKKSIQQLNAKSGDGDYDAPEGHHYDSTHSNRAARRRRASGR